MSKESKSKEPDEPKDMQPKTNADRSVTVPLDFPIEWGEEGLVTEIILKRLKGKHIKSMGKDAIMGDMFKMAGKVCGYSPAFFDEMDATDCMKVTEVIGDFLEGGQKTGRTA